MTFVDPSVPGRHNRSLCESLRALRRRHRQERLAHDAEHALARALRHRQETAELEARELDASLRTHRDEAEVREEVAREDRLVDVEALDRAVAFGIAVRERLQR